MQLDVNNQKLRLILRALLYYQGQQLDKKEREELDDVKKEVVFLLKPKRNRYKYSSLTK